MYKQYLLVEEIIRYEIIIPDQIVWSFVVELGTSFYSYFFNHDGLKCN